MRYAVILFIFLSACNRKLEHTPVVSIDPAFQGYVDQFVAESYRQGRPAPITDLVMRFTDQLVAHTLSECVYYNGRQTNQILVNAQDWPAESDEYRRVVIFHELGHCVLNREHVPTGTMRGGYCTPTSIMYPEVANERFMNMYIENWDALMVELFTGAGTAPPCSYTGYWGGT